MPDILDDDHWRDGVVVISGPSGSGKSTLVRQILERPEIRDGYRLSISATTRPIRIGETPDRDYFFVDRQTFLARRDAGQFLEWAEVHGNYYGTPKDWVFQQLREGRRVLLEIDVHGAIQVKRRIPSAQLIFVHVGGMDELERRLRARKTEEESVLKRRLSNAEAELNEAHRYDLRILNDDLKRAVDELTEVLARRGRGSGGQDSHA